MSDGTRRSSTDISLDMLSAIKNGVNRPTRIMYECNLSYQMCKSKLEELVVNDLVMEKEVKSRNRKSSHTVYKITEKGVEMIETLEQLKNLLNL
jgi:predicted transcriptional regulator